MSERLPWNQWVKALRAEMGARTSPPRKHVSQSDLAERLGLGLSAVARWEMAKNPQKPERDSVDKLLKLASKELQSRAPSAAGASVMSDPDRSLPGQDANGGYTVTSDQGKIIARKFDAMKEEDRDEALRKCLNVLAGEPENFREPDADEKRHRARHS